MNKSGMLRFRMETIYAKSAVDSIPGHILKALKEEMEHATR